MRRIELRGDPPLPDGALLVRGGLHALDVGKVRDDAVDSQLRTGVLAISTFGTPDGDVEALCRRIARLGRPGPGQLWIAEVGALRREGFALLDTPPDEHYDVVLADVEELTIARLRRCFRLQDNPTRRPRGDR